MVLILNPYQTAGFMVIVHCSDIFVRRFFYLSLQDVLYCYKILYCLGKVQETTSILTSMHVSPLTRGKVFSACVCSALLHGSETWAPTASDLQRLRRNDRAMIRWICGVKPHDEVPMETLHTKLGI